MSHKATTDANTKDAEHLEFGAYRKAATDSNTKDAKHLEFECRNAPDGLRSNLEVRESNEISAA